ncbi:hypothetical protein ACVWZW_004767 [Bradyrhizobium sp. F1.13.4]
MLCPTITYQADAARNRRLSTHRILRNGARARLAKAVGKSLTFSAKHAHLKTAAGHQRVVRHVTYRNLR